VHYCLQQANSRLGPHLLVKENGAIAIVFKEKSIVESNVPLQLHLHALLAVYYLLDLQYPSCWGQTLGFLQQFALGAAFKYSSKTCQSFLENMNRYAACC
jgi:hypothetical protein